MDYETFRHFSDSWGLIYMVAVFVLVALFVFRPGSKKEYDDVSQIPFKRD